MILKGISSFANILINTVLKPLALRLYVVKTVLLKKKSNLIAVFFFLNDLLLNTFKIQNEMYATE